MSIGPGNAGTAEVGADLPDVDPMKFDTVLAAIRRNPVECVFVGPETPLAAGHCRLPCPTRRPCHRAGEIRRAPGSEQSLLQGVPREERDSHGARHGVLGRPDPGDFSPPGGRKAARCQKKRPCRGKGVLESASTDELLSFGRDIVDEDRLLVEEYLEGWELSVFGVSDGESHVILPACTDFKKAGEDDTGPNTGGMGSICPVLPAHGALLQRVEREIVEPTYAAMGEGGAFLPGVPVFRADDHKGRNRKSWSSTCALGIPRRRFFFPFSRSISGAS